MSERSRHPLSSTEQARLNRLEQIQAVNPDVIDVDADGITTMSFDSMPTTGHRASVTYPEFDENGNRLRYDATDS
jgi:hypothetical protein